MGVVRLLTSSIVLGLLIALYGLGTHYVSAMRQYAPMKVAGWFDVKSQVGNVFYSAAVNGAQLPAHVWEGHMAEAVQNLTNLAGIRSAIYTRLIYADATNSAEWFVRVVPYWIGGLLCVRVLTWFYRRRDAWRGLKVKDGSRVRRKGTSRRSEPKKRGTTRTEAPRREWRLLGLAVDDLLIYGARISLASAVFASVLLNATAYYQNVSGLTGYLSYIGTGLATTLDLVGAAGTAVFKELIWHGSFLVTDGKEKTVGVLLGDRNIEFVSHYLARFPEGKITAALHTAVYQALVSGGLWALAHTLQRRRAQSHAARYQKLPPHMKRYLAQRPKHRRRVRRVRGRLSRRAAR